MPFLAATLDDLHALIVKIWSFVSLSLILISHGNVQSYIQYAGPVEKSAACAPLDTNIVRLAFSMYLALNRTIGIAFDC